MIRNQNFLGEFSDLLANLNDAGKYISTFSQGLEAFFGGKKLGWTAANQLCEPLAVIIKNDIVSDLSIEQLETMASELPNRANSLIASGFPGGTRYTDLVTKEVPLESGAVEKIAHTIWLYLMSQMEYLPIEKDVKVEAAAKAQSLVKSLVTDYIASKGWGGSSFNTSSLTSFFTTKNIVIGAGLLLALAIFKSSKHTKIGA